MTKHTPGPWEVLQKIVIGGEIPYTPVYATTLIAKVYSTKFKDYEQSFANARLIAAAPDLLEALKYSCKTNKSNLSCGTDQTKCDKCKIGMSIAKAGGRNESP